jgi:hypothetical protein
MHRASLPPSPPPLLGLHLDLTLLRLPKALNLTTVLLILPHPMLRQPSDILNEALWPAIPYPQAQHQYRTPKCQPYYHIHPEHDCAVHHVQNFERDEEYGKQREDAGDVGLCYEACDEWVEMCLEGSCDAEAGGEEGEEWVGERHGEETGEEGRIVYVVLACEDPCESARETRALYEVHDA